jgi:hypothetical protein
VSLLFSELALGGVRLKNRIVSTAHATALVDRGVPTDDDLAYWEARAAGGAALLIIGGVQIMGGKNRAMIVAGAAVELAVCVFWIIRVAAIDSQGVNVIDAGKGLIIGFAIFFAIMPTISLVMALGGSTTQFLQSRRGV